MYPAADRSWWWSPPPNCRPDWPANDSYGALTRRSTFLERRLRLRQSRLRSRNHDVDRCGTRRRARFPRASLRQYRNRASARSAFWATFIVNVVGCVTIGLLAGRIASGRLPLTPLARTFVFVGVLGGF